MVSTTFHSHKVKTNNACINLFGNVAVICGCNLYYIKTRLAILHLIKSRHQIIFSRCLLRNMHHGIKTLN